MNDDETDDHFKVQSRPLKMKDCPLCFGLGECNIDDGDWGSVIMDCGNCRGTGQVPDWNDFARIS